MSDRRAGSLDLVTPLARIARLSAAFLGSNLARAAIAFGLSFTLARGLGAERFGRWILCTAWASTLTVVVDLGFGVLLTRDGARPDADAGRLLGGALVLRLALAVPLAVLLSAVARYVSSDAETIAGLRVAAILGTAGAVYGCFGALVRSQPRWLPAVLGVETGWLALQLAGAYWIVNGAVGRAGRAEWVGRAGGSGRTIVWLMALAVVVQLGQIATAMVCWASVFGERGRVRLPSARALILIVRRAAPFAGSGLVANAQARLGPLMIGALSTQAELGLFAAASRFGSVARLAPQAVFAGALPVISREHHRDRASAARVSRTVDRGLLALSTAFAVGGVAFAAPVSSLVYGSSFASAAPALRWIGVGLIPLLSNSSRKVFLYASGGEALVVFWSTVALIVQAGVGAALIPTLGSAGAAASVAAGEAIIWWPLRHAAPRSPAMINTEHAERAKILCT